MMEYVKDGSKTEVWEKPVDLLWWEWLYMTLPFFYSAHKELGNIHFHGDEYESSSVWFKKSYFYRKKLFLQKMGSLLEIHKDLLISFSHVVFWFLIQA